MCVCWGCGGGGSFADLAIKISECVKASHLCDFSLVSSERI